MRFKFLLVAAVAVIASLALVPAAGAKSSSISVTTTPTMIDHCRAAPDQVGFKFQFKAKIKRRNSPKPKNVRVEYRVTDAATGAVLATGKVTLTPRNKFKRNTPQIVVAAGTSLVYNFQSVYNAPRTGKKVKAKGSSTDQVPSVEQLDAINPPLPACA